METIEDRVKGKCFRCGTLDCQSDGCQLASFGWISLKDADNKWAEVISEKTRIEKFKEMKRRNAFHAYYEMIGEMAIYSSTMRYIK